MKKKYVVHEGYVKSSYDKDIHFISFHQLCELYQIDCRQAIRAKDLHYGMKDIGYTHLYPDPTGNYSMPEEKG